MFKRMLFNTATALVMCFGLVIFVTYRNVNQKVQTMADERNKYVAHKNIQLIENEFESTFANLDEIARFHNIEKQGNYTGLTYSDYLAQDTSTNSTYWKVDNTEAPDSSYQTIIEALKKDSLYRIICSPCKKEDTLQISFAIKHTTKAGTTQYFGVDKKLLELQQKFANLQDMGFAYLTLIASDGCIVLDPGENRIGKQSREIKEFSHFVEQENSLDYNKTYIVHSSFLNLSVNQFFLPFDTPYTPGWVVAVSIPSFTYMNTPYRIRNTQIIIGIASILLMLIIIYTGFSYWQKENKKRQQAERLKNELELKNQQHAYRNIENQMNNLKRQLNPHFLFNSLSSLYTLVGKDPELARRFVMNLSKLYRKLLLRQREHFTLVKDEVELVKHYIFLQKIRFGEALHVTVDIDIDLMKNRVLSQSLILLTENAMKHNLATKSTPLELIIKADNKHLIVSNTYRPNPNVKDSTGTGIKNLEQRYQLYKINLKPATIEDGCYVARLPYIEK